MKAEQGGKSMSKEFLTKIKSSSNQFTKAEKKVADFVLQNPKKVLFMSITDLAEACDVGDTSVFRFCKTMELKGYQEFKMMLSLDLGDGGKKHSQLTGDVELDDTFTELSQKVLNTNISALQETYSLLDRETFENAIDILDRARKIYFFGVGASGLAAMARDCATVRGIDTMVCSGGVLHNRLLAARLTFYLADFTLLFAQQLPAGDGAIAYGQAVIAAARGQAQGTQQ